MLHIWLSRLFLSIDGIKRKLRDERLHFSRPPSLLPPIPINTLSFLPLFGSVSPLPTEFSYFISCPGLLIASLFLPIPPVPPPNPASYRSDFRPRRPPHHPVLLWFSSHGLPIPFLLVPPLFLNCKSILA